MPNIKSAMKRMRSDAKKRERNQKVLAELSTLNKRMRRLSDAKKANEIARKLISRLDRAVTKGIIARSSADRKKSRIENFLKNNKSKKK